MWQPMLIADAAIAVVIALAGALTVLRLWRQFRRLRSAIGRAGELLAEPRRQLATTAERASAPAHRQ